MVWGAGRSRHMVDVDSPKFNGTRAGDQNAGTVTETNVFHQKNYIIKYSKGWFLVYFLELKLNKNTRLFNERQ